MSEQGEGAGLGDGKSPQPPRGEELDALLVEIGETLDEVEELPALTSPSKPWPGWGVWALAGALGCGVAGALAAGNVWTGQGPTFAYRGLPAWAWGGINGALIGSLSGPACAIWGRVRRKESFKSAQGLALIVLLSAAALTLAFGLIQAVTALVMNQRGYLPSPEVLPSMFWGNLVYGCALAGGVLSHVGTKSLPGRLFFSWILCMLLYLPILLLGTKLFPYMADVDFFWRGGFPYYLAFPLSWWLASRIKPDPLPVLSAEEESSDDA